MQTADSPSTPADAARTRLETRLSVLAAGLVRRADALALLALGSLAAADGRVDAHSDLDFFVLVRAGAKQGYLDDLGWLAAAHPLAWHFRNTVDGCKALMQDGVFCEFAVFEPGELTAIPYSPGRFVWRRDEVDPALAIPVHRLPAPSDPAWLAGEALSNLLVGLHRCARGERLAAMRLVQVHALDRVLELREHRTADAAPRPGRDAFAVDRRIEVREPGLVGLLERLAPGYAATPQAALALLDELERLHPVPLAVGAEIRRLAAAALPPDFAPPTLR